MISLLCSPDPIPVRPGETQRIKGFCAAKPAQKPGWERIKGFCAAKPAQKPGWADAGEGSVAFPGVWKFQYVRGCGGMSSGGQEPREGVKKRHGAACGYGARGGGGYVRGRKFMRGHAADSRGAW